MVGFTILARAVLLIALAFVAARLLRRSSASRRADLWRATFVALALLPLAALALPPLEWVPRLPSTANAETGAGTALAEAPFAPSGEPAADLVSEPLLDEDAAVAEDSSVADDPGLVAVVAERGSAPHSPRAATAPGALRRDVLIAALLGVWAIGAVLLLSRLIAGLARAARIAREGLPVGREGAALVVESAAAPSAFVLDRRPFGPATIVLPAGLEGAAWRRAVLAHERFHVERRDGLFLPFASAVAALLWPTLLVRFALDRLRIESERAADDAVLRAGVPPSSYAGRLVALSRGPAALTVQGMAVPGMAASAVTRRVEALLDAALDRRASGRASRAVTLLLASACGVSVAASEWKEAVATPTAAVQDAQSADAQAGAVNERSDLIERGLDALVAMQTESGAWKGDVGYKLNNDWRVTADDVPHVGATGLAIEALLRGGARPMDTMGHDERADALAQGLAFLRATQSESGQIALHFSRMRDHAHALRGLAVALAMLDDPALVDAVQRGLRWSLDVRGKASGLWRFTPLAEDVDILEVAHQLDACRAALDALGERANAQAVLDMRAVEERAHAFAETVRFRLVSADPAGLDGPVGFRFQATEHARMTANTTLAGFVVLGPWGALDSPLGLFRNVLDRILIAGPRHFGRISVSHATPLSHPPDRGHQQWTHFLGWDTLLLARRAIDLDGFAVRPDDVPDLDSLKGMELLREGEEIPRYLEWTSARTAWEDFERAWTGEVAERLTALQRADGTWPCSVGVGDAYSTAVACVLASPR